jgi:hypothetical protein
MAYSDCLSEFSLLTQHASNFKDSDSSASEDKFFHSFHTLICFAVTGHPKLAASSAQFTPLAMTVSSQTCALPSASSPRAAFNVLKVYIKCVACLM